MPNFIYRLQTKRKRFIVRAKGGPGSGDWGHTGRPGKRGGSAGGKMGGMSNTSLVDAAKRAGEKYFGKGLIFDAGDVSNVTQAQASDMEKEVLDFEGGGEPGGVPLVDPDWTYVLEYDPKTGSVSAPEGYDPHGGSSAEVFTRAYVNEFNDKNPDKLLMTYNANNAETAVWPALEKVKTRAKVAKVKKKVTPLSRGKPPVEYAADSGKPGVSIIKAYREGKYTALKNKGGYATPEKTGWSGGVSWSKIVEIYPNAVKPTEAMYWIQDLGVYGTRSEFDASK